VWHRSCYFSKKSNFTNPNSPANQNFQAKVKVLLKRERRRLFYNGKLTSSAKASRPSRLSVLVFWSGEEIDFCLSWILRCSVRYARVILALKLTLAKQLKDVLGSCGLQKEKSSSIALLLGFDCLVDVFWFEKLNR